jgi:hypothetical protein
LAVIAVVLVGGCRSRDQPTTKLGSETVRVESTGGPTDRFGLPLVISLEPPEVPKEVERPSPPVEETLKAAPKKSSPPVKETPRAVPKKPSPGP